MADLSDEDPQDWMRYLEAMAKRLSRDWISELPDELLIHILSLLHNTNECARTSFLSRRWRHLWTHVPSIHLSLRHVEPPANYVAAVDACLGLVATPSLDRLSLHLWLPTSCPPATARANSRAVDRWFRFARDRSVRRLNLTGSFPPSGSDGDPWIPSSIFCCRELVTLHTMHAAFPMVPSHFRGFHSLKTLSISCGTIDDDTVAGLLACCPLLESLSLIGCRDLYYVEVSQKDLPNLKRLLLMSDNKSSFGAYIDAPNLEFIKFTGDLNQLVWKGSTVLHEAIIKGNEGMEFDTKHDWLKFLLVVSNASVLTTSNWFCQSVIPEQSMFKKLKKLFCYFDWFTGFLLYNFISNLKECPMLEYLYIKFNHEARSLVKDSIRDTYCGTQAPVDDFSRTINTFLKTVEDNHENDGFELPEHFLELAHPMHHLRTVRMEEFVGSKNEMILVKFLFRSAVLLEEFIVFDFLLRELDQLFAPIDKSSSQVHMKLTVSERLDLPIIFK